MTDTVNIIQGPLRPDGSLQTGQSALDTLRSAEFPLPFMLDGLNFHAKSFDLEVMPDGWVFVILEHSPPPEVRSDERVVYEAMINPDNGIGHIKYVDGVEIENRYPDQSPE